MAPEVPRRQRIDELQTKEKLADKILFAGLAEAVVGTALLATKTGDGGTIEAACWMSFIPIAGGIIQRSRYAWQRSDLAREEFLTDLREQKEHLMQTVREIPRSTFQNLWSELRGIRGALLEAESRSVVGQSVETEPFNVIYQTFEERAGEFEGQLD